MSKRQPRVVSVGYEKRSVQDLVALLQGARVRRVLDVRALPLSRRKGFSKTALSESLGTAGIDYIHVPAAGNPYRHMAATTAACLSHYSRHLRRHPDIVAQVGALVRRGAVAVLCYERNHEECHRSVLLSCLVEHGQPIRIVRLE